MLLVTLNQILLLVISPLAVASKAHTHFRQITEEQPARTFIIDLKQDTGFANVKFVVVSTDYNRSLFSIHPDSGVVQTVSAIDRDTICPRSVTCNLTLDVALQSSSLFQLVKLVIEIVDVNDNTPKFANTRVVESLTEGIGPGFFLPIQPAADRDSPVNGIIRYHLITTSQAFELKVQDTGDGSLEPRLELKETLDREQQAFHSLKIIATDGGTPPKSGSTVLDVVVLDVNDNTPKFLHQVYEIEVVESGPSQKLLTVRADDADEGLNGRIRYGFSDRSSQAYSSKFHITSDTGIISTVSELDFEVQSQIILEVIAADQGESSLSSTTRVIVNVRDRNDNAPEIKVDLLAGDECAESC